MFQPSGDETCVSQGLVKAANAENVSNVRQLLTEKSPDGPHMQPHTLYFKGGQIILQCQLLTSKGRSICSVITSLTL